MLVNSNQRKLVQGLLFPMFNHMILMVLDNCIISSQDFSYQLDSWFKLINQTFLKIFPSRNSQIKIFVVTNCFVVLQKLKYCLSNLFSVFFKFFKFFNYFYISLKILFFLSLAYFSYYQILNSFPKIFFLSQVK